MAIFNGYVELPEGRIPLTHVSESLEAWHSTPFTPVGQTTSFLRLHREICFQQDYDSLVLGNSSINSAWM